MYSSNHLSRITSMCFKTECDHSTVIDRGIGKGYTDAVLQPVKEDKLTRNGFCGTLHGPLPIH